MNLEIFLIRHGETDWNRSGRVQGSSDIELNQLGHIQAAKMANHLSLQKFDAIYCSSSRRAIETAQPLTLIQNLEAVVTSDIVEIGYGDWEGHTSAEIHERWPEAWSAFKQDSYKNRPPNGETIEQVRARLERFYNQIQKNHSGGKIAVVSHGGAIRYFIGLLICESTVAATRIDLSNCAVSRLVVGPSGPRLVLLGDTHFLV